MLKYITQENWSDGTPVVQLLHFSGAGVKTASAVHEEVKEFVSSLKPREKHIYVLVNALGAGEYYGSNLNADYFAEEDLIGDPGGSYGHRTFKTAGVFRFHQNKDIGISFGKVLLAVYNKRMHRVELVLELSEDLANKHGHSDLYAKLSGGQSMPVSMGCRIAFDVCMRCGKESKTFNDRCECMRTQQNAITSEGIRVCVKNPKPRFFDISFVALNADAIGFSMTKLASTVNVSATAELRVLLQKTAEADKFAEFEKRVPAVAMPAFNNVRRSEKALPYELLERLAAEAGEPRVALSSLAANGVALDPREFQTIIMISSGDAADARRLYDRNEVFRVPSVTFDEEPVLSSQCCRQLPCLADILPLKSGLEEYLLPRLFGQNNPQQCSVPTNFNLLHALGPAYNSYRLEAVRKAPALSLTCGMSRSDEFTPVLRGFLTLTGRQSYDEGGMFIPLAREDIVGDILRGLSSLARSINH